MKQFIKNLKRLFGFGSYRPVDPAHVFVGVNVDEGFIGIIVEEGEEEIEIKLEPYRAAMLADNITKMLEHL